MTDNINIEKPLPIKTYNVSKVNEKLKRLEDAIESASGGITPEEVQTMIDTSIEDKQDVLTAGQGIDITENHIKVDSSWELLTENPTINTIKDTISEYDYLFVNDSNTYPFIALINEENSKIISNKIITSSGVYYASSGAIPGCVCEFTRYGSSPNNYITHVKYPESITLNSSTSFGKFYALDGTEINTTNYTTYFTDGIPNQVILYIHGYVFGIMMPNKTANDNVILAGGSDGNAYGTRITYANMYKEVSIGTHTSMPLYATKVSEWSTTGTNKIYRRKRLLTAIPTQ